MEINWNMVILLVFITFNVIQICNVLKNIFCSRTIMQELPRELMKRVVEESIEKNK